MRLDVADDHHSRQPRQDDQQDQGREQTRFQESPRFDAIGITPAIALAGLSRGT